MIDFRLKSLMRRSINKWIIRKDSIIMTRTIIIEKYNPEWNEWLGLIREIISNSFTGLILDFYIQSYPILK